MSKRKPYIRTIKTQADIERHRVNRYRVHRISPEDYDIQFVLRFSPEEMRQNKRNLFKT